MYVNLTKTNDLMLFFATYGHSMYNFFILNHRKCRKPLLVIFVEPRKTLVLPLKIKVAKSQNIFSFPSHLQKNGQNLCALILQPNGKR